MTTLILAADKFEMFSGKKEYAIDLEDGDCQLDYLVLSDCPCAVYVACGDKVLPIAVGVRCQGRVLVRDAKWIMIKPEKVSACVAIQVYHARRRITDHNDGKPVAVYVPQLPPIDLRAQVNRLVAQRLEESDSYLIERDDPELPDDIDDEFGAGSTQLEEDEEIEEYLHAQRERAAAAKAGKGGKAEGKGGSETDGGEAGDDSGGGEQKKRAKKASKKPEAAVEDD